MHFKVLFVRAQAKHESYGYCNNWLSKVYQTFVRKHQKLHRKTLSQIIAADQNVGKILKCIFTKFEFSTSCRFQNIGNNNSVTLQYCHFDSGVTKNFSKVRHAIV